MADTARLAKNPQFLSRRAAVGQSAGYVSSSRQSCQEARGNHDHKSTRVAVSGCESQLLPTLHPGRQQMVAHIGGAVWENQTA